MSKINRRNFLGLAIATTTVVTTTNGFPNILKNVKPIILPSLPYKDDALSPVISANTIGFHYGKHHKGYVDNLNKILDKTEFADLTLEKIVEVSRAKNSKMTKAKLDATAIFNNAAQIWNHNFYWNSLNPKGGGKPTGRLLEKINDSFGDFDAFKKNFATTTISQFGTGWGWLVADKKGKLQIVKTGDAEIPNLNGMKPLLTIDVWEHAYYLDYQNRRADYVNAVLEKLINWEFATQNLG